jgi:hypothetical protein
VIGAWPTALALGDIGNGRPKTTAKLCDEGEDGAALGPNGGPSLLLPSIPFVYCVPEAKKERVAALLTSHLEDLT